MSDVPTEVAIKSPPEPPKTQTITIPTTSPLLIPDEEKATYCFNRRNFFDIIIGLLIAIGIIYFVMYNNRGGNIGFGDITGMFTTTTTGSGGILGTGPSPPSPKPVTATGLGSGIGQLGGYLKKLFK